MDLFKNKVGRPSNETLKKRKMFYILAFAIVLVIIGVGSLLLNSKTEKLSGLSVNKSVIVTVNNITKNSFVIGWNINDDSLFTNVEIRQSDKNKKVGSVLVNYSQKSFDMKKAKSDSVKIINLSPDKYYLARLYFNKKGTKTYADKLVRTSSSTTTKKRATTTAAKKTVKMNSNGITGTFTVTKTGISGSVKSNVNLKSCTLYKYPASASTKVARFPNGSSDFNKKSASISYTKLSKNTKYVLHCANGNIASVTFTTSN